MMWMLSTFDTDSFVMALHDRYFLEELYTEHLEEAAFQYETRLNWLSDEEIAWQDLDDLDNYLEAHLDALVVGDKFALDFCLDNLDDADASILHVMVRLFCRHQRIDCLSKVWLNFDFDDTEKGVAVADALKWECPESWFPSLLKVFSGPKTEMYNILAPSVAYRSRDTGEALLSALSKAREDSLANIIWAVSRCEKNIKQEAIKILAPYLKKDELVSQTVIALMMMGESKALAQCEPFFTVLPIAFSLGGGLSHSRKIIEILKGGGADEESILAAGLSGNLEAVAPLLTYLKHPDHANTAAEALQLMTGANLYIEEHVADKVEEDELFDHEIEAFKQGELPKNIDGNPFGVEVRKLSIDKDVWLQWFQENKQQFVKGKRYRNGRLFSPAELLNNLLSNQSSFELREYAYEELVIRYGMDIQFAADDLIYKQQAQLNEIHQWVHKSQSLFPAGRWLFAGQELLS